MERLNTDPLTATAQIAWPGFAHTLNQTAFNSKQPGKHYSFFQNFAGSFLSSI